MLVWSVFYLLKFLLLSLVFAYIYILQSSVEMHLPCGGIYNNHIIANCLCEWKKIKNWSIIGEHMDKSKAHVFWPTVYSVTVKDSHY